MNNQKSRWIFFVCLISVSLMLVSLLFISACGNLKPPEECTFTGTADQNIFQQYAYFVTLVVEKTPVGPGASSMPVKDPLLEGPFTFTTQA